MLKVILNRLKPQAEEIIAEEQAGFRAGRSTTEQIFNLRILCYHVTNEEVRRKIQAAIGEYNELLTLVKKRKLRWFGHVSRSSGLAKTILQGTVKGKRKRGR